MGQSKKYIFSIESYLVERERISYFFVNSNKKKKTANESIFLTPHSPLHCGNKNTRCIDIEIFST